jgi:hypothetical protein
VNRRALVHEAGGFFCFGRYVQVNGSRTTLPSGYVITRTVRTVERPDDSAVHSRPSVLP